MSEYGEVYDEPKTGDIVRSRWSSSGALWRVESIISPGPWNHSRVSLYSLKTGRRDTRFVRDLRKVGRTAVRG